jgi:hypothetical protein
VNILAAWPRNISVSGNTVDDRQLSYNIVLGTSMACPHASSATAYIKGGLVAGRRHLRLVTTVTQH